MENAMTKSYEDEEFEYLEQLNQLRGQSSEGWRKRQVADVNSAESAFLDWAEHSHHPQHFHIERKAFIAGWRAGRQSLRREEND
jgi:hypothetical protein